MGTQLCPSTPSPPAQTSPGGRRHLPGIVKGAMREDLPVAASVLGRWVQEDSLAIGSPENNPGPPVRPRRPR